MARPYILLALAVLLASGCIDQAQENTAGTGLVTMDSATNANLVEVGDTVSVNYIGALEDGTIFDTSYEETAKQAGLYNPQRSYEPLVFNVGAGQMIQGFDEGVQGMSKGEEKEIRIPPEKGYGQINPDAIFQVPVDTLKENNITPEVGMVLQSPAGLVLIVQVNETHATLDANHELAGKTLIFTVKVEDIQKA